jgi:hypothetical protein
MFLRQLAENLESSSGDSDEKEGGEVGMSVELFRAQWTAAFI